MGKQENLIITNDYRQTFLGLERKNPPETGFLLKTQSKEHLQSYIHAENASWDSRVLNLKCASLTDLYLRNKHDFHILRRLFKRMVTLLDDHGYDMCKLRIGLNDLILCQLAEEHGFRLMDVMTVFISHCELAFDAAKNNTSLSFVSCSSKDQKLKEQAMAIAENSFVHSRIYQDPHIKKNQAQAFYQKLTSDLWENPKVVKKALCQKNGDMLGFYLAETEEDSRVDKGIGLLHLISVDPLQKRRGLGHALLAHFVKHMLQKSPLVEVATQVNNKANQLYLKAGLKQVSHLATFHRWRS